MTWLYIPSPSAQASAASTSASELLDPTRAASLTWRGKQAQSQALSRAWKRGGFIRLLSGLTCEPSTLAHGAAQWIASCLATRAKGTASRESVAALTMTAGCSTARSKSSIKAGLLCSSARTSRGISPDSSPLPSRHWSDWGAALRAEYSARLRPVRAIDASGSSSWPTATARMHKGGGDAVTRSDGKSRLDMLDWAAEQWPSDLSKRGGSQAPEKRKAGGHTVNLEDQAEHWMTPNVPNGGRTASHATMKGRTATRADGSKVQIGLEHQAQVWATPQARDHFPAHTPEYVAAKKAQGHGMRNLNDEAANWSTPRASDGEKGGPNMRGSKGDQPLPAQAAHWPTPMAGAAGTDTYNAAGNSDFSRKAEELAKGVRAFAMTDLSLPDRPTPSGVKSSETRRRLNPLFVEWLMGWPEGLSGFDTAAMASCHSPLPSHGCGCMNCWLTTQRAMLSDLLTIAPPAQATLL